MAVDLEPASFLPVVVRDHFDWPAYEELGIKIGKLIDPNKGRLLRMRVAAGRYAANGTVDVDAWRDLNDTYGTVTRAMQTAGRSFIESMASVTPEHPALQAYAERRPEVLENASTRMRCTSRSRLEDEIASRHCFSLVLVTANPGAVHDEQAPPYKLIEGPACGIIDPGQVAPELAQARVAIAGIVGL